GPMSGKPILVFGSGHLASRIARLATERGLQPVRMECAPPGSALEEGSRFAAIRRSLAGVHVDALYAAILVDDEDDRNLEMAIALMSLPTKLPIVASMFNENVSPHLQASHPELAVLSPARIAAPAFVAALDAPLQHGLRYTPRPHPDRHAPSRSDGLVRALVLGFAGVLPAPTTSFHFGHPLLPLRGTPVVARCALLRGRDHRHGGLRRRVAAPLEHAEQADGHRLDPALDGVHLDDLLAHRRPHHQEARADGARTPPAPAERSRHPVRGGPAGIAGGRGALEARRAASLGGAARGSRSRLLPAIPRRRRLRGRRALAARVAGRGRGAGQGALLARRQRLREPGSGAERALVRAQAAARAAHLRRGDGA